MNKSSKQPAKAAVNATSITRITRSKIVLASVSLLAVSTIASVSAMALYEPKPVSVGEVKGVATSKTSGKPAAKQPVQPSPAPAAATSGDTTAAQTAISNNSVSSTANTAAKTSSTTTAPNANWAPISNATSQAPAPSPAPAPAPTPTPAPAPAPAPAPSPAPAPAPQPSFELNLLADSEQHVLLPNYYDPEFEMLNFSEPVHFVLIEFSVSRQNGHNADLLVDARAASGPQADEIACYATFIDELSQDGVLIMAVPDRLQAGDYICEIAVSDGTTTRTAQHGYSLEAANPTDPTAPGFNVTIDDSSLTSTMITDPFTGETKQMLSVGFNVNLVNGYETNTWQLPLARTVSKPAGSDAAYCGWNPTKEAGALYLMLPNGAPAGEYVCEIVISDSTLTRTAQYTFVVPETQPAPVEIEL